MQLFQKKLHFFALFYANFQPISYPSVFVSKATKRTEKAALGNTLKKQEVPLYQWQQT